MRGMKMDLIKALSMLPKFDSGKGAAPPDSSFHSRRSRAESEQDSDSLELSTLSTLSPVPKRVNEVMERCEEISNKVREEAEKKAEQKAQAAAGVLGLDLVGGHVPEEEEQPCSGGSAGYVGSVGFVGQVQHTSLSEHFDDNISTTLSSAETSSDLFWDCGGSRDGDRESRPLVLCHNVEPGDSVGGICVKYGVSLGQLLQANRAFSSQSLLARKTLVIPNVAQMDM
eukprot:CAMPEP_0206243144 /NCGR_PEP_ID=MMETSP0047_2-20121206/17450_1 /ASSEMBLY_ACC=CAM_ASM_000192 /TAXON_ID=195065 /ORGANISM="Chroomonas mesostigmatica_cf, Strain CCMP1168" /LENGTH=226 /DNA_ID=CAMNT_0053668243 /DNA_START=21 /DNA_END=701 /DNA_ORIENTATION=-